MIPGLELTDRPLVVSVLLNPTSKNGVKDATFWLLGLVLTI
jgi:hypothetical protein